MLQSKYVEQISTILSDWFETEVSFANNNSELKQVFQSGGHTIWMRSSHTMACKTKYAYFNVDLIPAPIPNANAFCNLAATLRWEGKGANPISHRWRASAAEEAAENKYVMRRSKFHSRLGTLNRLLIGRRRRSTRSSGADWCDFADVPWMRQFSHPAANRL